MPARVRTRLRSLATKRLNRGTRGQAIIEFVVIFPIIIVLLAAIIDFGIAMDRRLVLQHAVREGARFAAVQQDTADIVLHTKNESQGILDATASTCPDDTSGQVCVCYKADGGSPAGHSGSRVEVRAKFDYDLVLLSPVLSGLFGGTVGTITMDPHATARLEHSVTSPEACPP